MVRALGARGAGLSGLTVPRQPDTAEVLAGTTMFGSLDRPALLRLASSFVSRSYPRGEYLCRQGDPGDSLFVVADGRVKVVLRTDQGEELLLSTLGPSDVFGELAVLDRGPRSASVVAVEPSSMLVLTRARLVQAIRANPDLVDSVLAALGALARRLTQQQADQRAAQEPSG